jgi:HK97 family phage prohead protease
MAALRRSGAPEVKRAELPLLQANEAGAFSGYASLFGVVDSGGDMVMAGAFARSLVKRGAQGVKMLWQHQAAEPIGLWTSIVEDARGLKVEGRLDLSVARAREALSLMRKGAVDGLSIGFRALRATTEKSSGVRRLQEIDLWEISIVTFPMLPQARIGVVKHDRSSATSMTALCAKLARLKAQRAALEFAHALRRMSGNP